LALWIERLEVPPATAVEFGPTMSYDDDF